MVDLYNEINHLKKNKSEKLIRLKDLQNCTDENVTFSRCLYPVISSMKRMRHFKTRTTYQQSVMVVLYWTAFWSAEEWILLFGKFWQLMSGHQFTTLISSTPSLCRRTACDLQHTISEYLRESNIKILECVKVFS